MRALASAIALASVAACAQLSAPLPPLRTSAPSDSATALGAQSADARELVVWAETFTPLAADLDPFSATALPGVRGGIIESLFVFHRAADLDPVPMLAESAAFNDAGTELRITLRSGVEWSDGQPFTADDVVYSYLLESGKLSYLTDARVEDERTVILQFAEPQFAQEAQILQRPIVAQHAPQEPTLVGTGPFVLNEVTDEFYTLEANPTYWRGGQVEIPKVKFIAVNDHAEARGLLIDNDADWVGLFLPDADRIESFGYYSAKIERQEPLVIYTCANASLGCEGTQTDGAVRRALDAAIDREELIEKVFAGHAFAPSPAFTLLGESDPWLTDQTLAQSPLTADASRAASLLTEAGYERGESGIFEKDGEPLQLRIGTVEGWSDHNLLADLVAEQAKRAGIDLVVEPLPWEEFAASRLSGTFELIIGGMMASPDTDPLPTYAKWFGGQATTPVGTDLLEGTWNVARYSAERVDEAIIAAAATDDRTAKLDAYATIQAQIATDLPYIPLLITPTMSFYNSAEFTGWPTDEDPYAFSAPWGTFAVGLVLQSLAPSH